jgi:hypothetical protein
MSEILSSGGLLRATSLESSPSVLLNAAILLVKGADYEQESRSKIFLGSCVKTDP